MDHVEDPTVRAFMELDARAISPTTPGYVAEIPEAMHGDEAIRAKCARNPPALPRRSEHHEIVQILMERRLAIRCCDTRIHNRPGILCNVHPHRRQNAHCEARTLSPQANNIAR